MSTKKPYAAPELPVEVENQTPPQAAVATQSNDIDMADSDEIDEYPLRFYSDEEDTDPEDLDYDPESRPTSPMSLTESERGDFAGVLKDLHEYDTDPIVPPPPEQIQGALALYTEKELEVLRNAYEMVYGRPARWFKEQSEEPMEESAAGDSDDADESAVLVDKAEASGEEWVSV